MFFTTSPICALIIILLHFTPTMASITLAELHLFHSIDRDIFSRLVIPLKRQVTQSLLVMAFWLWLENAHKCEFISKLKPFSNNLIDAIANEASLCINLLKSKTPTTNYGSLNLISKVLGKEISLKTLSQLRYTAISGVKVFLNDACSRIFTDILLQVLPSTSSVNPNLPLVIPGFPHTTFGILHIYPTLPLYFTIPTETLRGWKLKFEAPKDDRTLFLTFSRGFPVSEKEAKEFFIRMCGDCIEYFEMEIVNEESKQSLYGKLVLRKICYMDQIMSGQYIAKFRKNGKHIWARKFERRDLRVLSSK